MSKKCFFCGATELVHNRLRGQMQRYKSKCCGHRYSGTKPRDKSKVITDYIEGKQTIAQLLLKYGVSERTIARDLDNMRHVWKISKEKKVVIQMGYHVLGTRFRLDGD